MDEMNGGPRTCWSESPGRRLGGVAAATTGATAVVLAAAMVLVNSPQWWRGLLAAAVVSGLSAAASVPLLAWGLRRTLTHAAVGYLLTVSAKMFVSIGGGLIAVLVGRYPALPTMLLIVVFYVVLLAAETAVIATAMWPATAGNATQNRNLGA